MEKLYNDSWVCDGCLTCVWDEHHIEDRRLQIGLAIDTGADMPDHNCEDKENCDCGCNSRHSSGKI